MTGLMTVGGISLFESRSVEQDWQTVTVAGRESITDFRGTGAPVLTPADVQAAHHNIIGLRDLVAPVVFSDKTHLTGFYRVTGSSSRLTKFGNGAAQDATWSLTLERIGSSRDVEIESRVPTIPRLDELAGTQTPSYWHAPAVGATSYWTGSTVPAGTVSRVSSDGTVTAYTGIPTNVAPRWTIPAESYLLGSSRILLDGIRRAGTSTPPHTTWEMHNGLVRVQSAADQFIVSCWDSGAWASAKGYQPTAPTSITTTPEMTIIRNDPEESAIRLSYTGTPGRLTVDLALRRGSRFVAGTIKRHSATTLGLGRTVAEAATGVTGGLRATAADADGNRYVIGSTRVISFTNGNWYMGKTSVTSLDFFVGHEFNATPATGDAFADLLLQYIGSAGERTRIVRR